MIIEVDRDAGEFTKRAETTAQAELLRHEAAVLAVARHPGVVELLGIAGDTLRLRLVDGPALAEMAGASDGDMVRIATAAATTLADLHDIGIVHGAPTTAHILINGAGQPVLCGFGRAATGCTAGGPEAAADTLALANGLRVRAPSGGVLEEVLVGAVQSGHHSIAARRLATILATAQGTPPIPRPRRRRPRVRTPARPARARAITAAIALVALAVMASLVGMIAAIDGHPRVPSPRHAAAVPTCPAVDVGCRPVSHPSGVIETPSGRFRIGQPGDLLVLGRWRCTAALPALLRPATGEVWVWDSWAGSAPQPARLVARLSGARSVQVDPGPSGCDLLGVQLGTGRVVVIHPGQPA